ncbi:MAG: hypothetical protein RL497_2331 [Pseudomonadota bacterium]|jgi:MurNAc alpha-1-phosphate uridylyltransferase
MIFAAGEGRRMLPLTLHTPKPLLPLGDPLIGHNHLIGHNLRRLKAAGVQEVVVNTAYLGAQIHTALGDGSAWGLRIIYSNEPFPLETGGALRHALPLLHNQPFLLINADVLCTYPLERLLARGLAGGELGHLVLVPNPEQHPQGDFVLDARGLLSTASTSACVNPSYTFSGISVLHPQLIRQYPRAREVFPLREAFGWAIEQGGLSGEVFDGIWLDVGTPARLADAQALWMQLSAN